VAGIDPHDVIVAAARHQVGLLPVEYLPMLAAEWLAVGPDTPTLRELAGLRRDDRCAAGLWPDVLAEMGVALPVPDPRRVLAPWAARLVLDGEREPGWLVEHLLHRIPFDDADDLVSLLYELDHRLETLALADHRMVLRCRAHAAPLTVCAGRWVCDSRAAAHDVADVGSLRRGDAEVIASSDS
jgi:hypothetical protein